MALFLDISEADGLPFVKAGDPTMIPVVAGQHEWDYDIVENALPPDFVERMRNCLCLAAGPEGRDYHWEIIERAPVGIDIDSAKRHGAKLVEAEEGGGA